MQPSDEPKSCTPVFCYGMCGKIYCFPPCIRGIFPRRKHKGHPLKSRHRGFYTPFSTLIRTVFRAPGQIMGAEHQHSPETLFAVMGAVLADFVILPSAVLTQKEGPFQPPLLAPAHSSPCSGASRPGRPFSVGFRSVHSRFASSSHSRIEGFVFSSFSPRRLLLITPSIIP